MLGHGENSIYEIQQCLNEMHFLNTIPVIADIQDEKRMQEVFLKFKPEIVYHAAAHKHVPLMEGNVKEAIKNNIIGTKNMVNISAEANVERFIMISTDKTVAPTSVMGATKKSCRVDCSK
ncbi:polysaccharide biosynthesis protein CapD [Listeria grayi FSL F6-1183]|uniref:Polysaccharide biosynthesis protein CapD n=1 Tax=Listeria grayi FSL F6-1183 TaxID=1265827 RepID=A0A829R4V2_LISGR|nr:polysaccharide biosynthesis protein CapD [Listeria grayi FSL F6-1183]